MNAQQHCEYIINLYLPEIFKHEDKEYRPRISHIVIIGTSRSYHLCDVLWELPYLDPKTGLWKVYIHLMNAEVRRLGGVHTKIKLQISLNFPDIFLGCADFKPQSAALVHALEEDVRCAADTLKNSDTIAVFKVR